MSEFQVPYVEREWDKTPDMSTEEGQEEVRKKLLGCIESGNVVVPKAVEETVNVRGEERKASEFDKEAVEEYMKDVEILEKEGLFTDHNTIVD
jgi:hypothetical protein